MGNIIGHVTEYKRRAQRPPAMVNTKQLHILPFLDGRKSVCKIICAIGDCLDTPGRLEDLPGSFFLVFGELTENLTRHRNELLSWRKRDHLTRSAVPGQQTVVDACACSKTVAKSQFCTSEMLTLCQLADTWLVVTLLLKLPSQTRTTRVCGLI